MKKNLLSVLLILVLLPVISAQETGPITLGKAGHRKTYLKEGKSVTAKELSSLLSNNSVSSGAYKTSKTEKIVGQTFLIGGTAIIAAGFLFELKSAGTVKAGDVSVTDGFARTGSALLLGGAIVMAGSLPFLFMSNSSFKKSINLYNSNMHSKTGGTSMRIDMGLTGNGIKLSMRF
jgi:hypothetical protein